MSGDSIDEYEESLEYFVSAILKHRPMNLAMYEAALKSHAAQRRIWDGVALFDELDEKGEDDA